MPQDEVHCRCTQQIFKALQLQHKIGSDLSSFIISLGNQGATNPKHPRLSPLCVTAVPGSEDRATTPPVPVSPTPNFTSQRSGEAGRAELGGMSVTAQEPFPPLSHPLDTDFQSQGRAGVGFPDQGKGRGGLVEVPRALQPPEGRTETASSQSPLLPDIKQFLILALLFCNPT